MLAPFFVNMLLGCVSLLLTGWALDLISAWVHSSRHGAPASNQPLIAPAQRVKVASPAHPCR
jgi:hypothetical protein